MLNFVSDNQELADFFEAEFGVKFRAELAELQARWVHRMNEVASRRQFFEGRLVAGSLPKLATPEIVLGELPEPTVVSEAVPPVEVTKDNLKTAKGVKR